MAYHERPASSPITGTATRNAASATVRGPKSGPMSGRLRLRRGRLRARDDRLDAELAQHRVGHRRRGARERVVAARHLRERDHLANVRLAGHEGDDPVDSCGEAAVRRSAHAQRVEEETELRALLVLPETHDAEDRPLRFRVVDPDRAGAELPAVPDEVVMLAQGRAGIVLEALVPGHGRRERVVHERPVAGVFIALEEREVDDPVENVAAGLREPELAAEMRPQPAEDAPDDRLVAGGEERRRPGAARERGELLLGEKLRDRRADLAAVVHEVRETLRSPLLGDLLQP